jgi:DICT domain-containing protein
VPFIRQGLSAAVYTQTTDVEIETNGLMTYDRKVMKVPAARLKAVNEQLYNPTIANVVKQ